MEDVMFSSGPPTVANLPVFVVPRSWPSFNPLTRSFQFAQNLLPLHHSQRLDHVLLGLVGPSTPLPMLLHGLDSHRERWSRDKDGNAKPRLRPSTFHGGLFRRSLCTFFLHDAHQRYVRMTLAQRCAEPCACVVRMIWLVSEERLRFVSCLTHASPSRIGSWDTAEYGFPPTTSSSMSRLGRLGSGPATAR